ncbi:MaoC/PaaZ C-terminal domain-containing protein [Streptomyces sp. NPDC047072]|uniref:MaoC/PaaZ C-terminal domain-containing protein n=1 Tax=Streptomyces sp. NPDC047072 TaxID=3154809 RepID=UPI0033CAA9D9
MLRGALRSPFKRPAPDADFPPTRLVLPGLRVDLARLAAYERVCGFPTGDDALPVTYPHVLGFPLAMSLMSGRTFPLPLLGLVHTSIEITRYRAAPATGEYELTVYVEGLGPHRRGTEAAVVTELRAGEELVWESVSTYLARHGVDSGRPNAGQADSGREDSGRADSGEAADTAPPNAPTAGPEAETPHHPPTGPEAHAPHHPPTTPEGHAPHPPTTPEGHAPHPTTGPEGHAPHPPTEPEAHAPLPAMAEWRLAGDIGRRYAAASGDRNPIHLYPLTARLFGFPRAIAHGMWTVARCLAAHGTPEAALVRAEFKAPVLLPGTVTYAADAERFELCGGDRVHVTGGVYPLTS